MSTIDPELLNLPHIRPLGDNVVVLPIYTEINPEDGQRQNDSGLFIPDTVDNEPIEGRVVALGDGRIDGCAKCEPEGKQHQFQVKIGDIVLFPIWKCLSIDLEDQEFFIISERDILGIQQEATS